MSDKDEETILIGPWRGVHGAIWLIGLAILAWRDWWWPGILVLVAISILLEAAIRQIPGATAPKTPAEKPAEQLPAAPVQEPEAGPDLSRLPEKCQECGAPIQADKVTWTSAVTANCSYCGAALKMKE